MILTSASLFSGAGGFDLAADMMGWKTIFQCEINPILRKTLAYYWKNAKQYEDIQTTDFTPYKGAINVLTAGFPCQPFSLAGQRKGANDERYLWGHTIRAITEIQPDWIVLENVVGITSILQHESISQVESITSDIFQENHSITKHSIHQRTLSIIINDITEAGYILPRHQDGTPIIFNIPAASVNAPHIRERIAIIAHSHSIGHRFDNINRKNRQKESKNESQEIQCKWVWNDIRRNGTKANVANTESKGRGKLQLNSQKKRTQGSNANKSMCSSSVQLPNATNTINSTEPTQKLTDRRKRPKNHNQRENNLRTKSGRFSSQRLTPYTTSKRFQRTMQRHSNMPTQPFQYFPTQSPVCMGDDGFSTQLDGITISALKRESIKAAGNAVVPQQWYIVFRYIGETMKMLNR